MGILRIVDDHGTAQAIAVLGSKVRMVPERSGLTRSGEVVKERITGSDRALIHKGRSVGPIRALLEHSGEALVV
jgi:hypothetical protein